MNVPTTLALIPARSGSKSVPDKNIRDFAGKPLLVHSIEHALAARAVSRVLVSTDSEHYAAVAREYGAETPFLRPAELATDDATDLVVFQHALAWLREQEAWEPEIVVHLRPTYPLRNPADIDRVVEILAGDTSLDSVRSVAPAPETPYKMWRRDADALLTPVADLGNEAYNRPRQSLPPVYLQNACIDAVRSRVIREQGSMTGRRIYGYVMDENLDVDTFADLERARGPAAVSGGGTPRAFCLDLDSVLTRAHTDGRTNAAGPRQDVIAAANRLFDAGCRISVQAGAGLPPADQEALLRRWGLRYHGLVHSRPGADYLVDGRAIGIDAFLAIAEVIASESHSQSAESDDS